MRATRADEPARADCGCTYRGNEWVQLCPACAREYKETHERWLREHRERHHGERAQPSHEYVDLL
jgi:hypothetical protein